MTPDLDLSQCQYLFTDVDDTLTTGGQLLPETFAALWQLHHQGVRIIPITGGCAGWCDQIIRTWPVDAVIGESGGFYIHRDAERRLQWQFWESREQHHIDKTSILATLKQLELGFDIHLARDQPFRLVDVAIDYNQDQRLSADQVERITQHLMKQTDFRIKQSSIHINIWRGDFSKGAMAERLLRNHYHLSDEQMRQRVVFVGDAPNDESMFERFPKSVGVANIRPHLPKMTHQPHSITQAVSGHGVVELINHWLTQRSNARD
ncbi:MAG: HAD-IIB family hydrolase [Saccharospirillum sp.]|nr:HAD-IIB family hydrolase [Saccharospirillum sp.]